MIGKEEISRTHCSQDTNLVHIVLSLRPHLIPRQEDILPLLRSGTAHAPWRTWLGESSQALRPTSVRGPGAGCGCHSESVEGLVGLFCHWSSLVITAILMTSIFYARNPR